jgi:hypothetical protein
VDEASSVQKSAQDVELKHGSGHSAVGFGLGFKLKLATDLIHGWGREVQARPCQGKQVEAMVVGRVFDAGTLEGRIDE